MRPHYRPPFKKFVKKQHPPLQLAIEDAVEQILEDPRLGEEKAGDLKGVFVFKFHQNSVEYLIAYRPPAEAEMRKEGAEKEMLHMDFYSVGTHENFYPELKRYLKAKGQ